MCVGGGISAQPYGRKLKPEQFLSELCCGSEETAKGVGNDGGGGSPPVTLNGSDAEFPRGPEDTKPMTLADANWRGALSNLSMQTPECFFSYFMGFCTGQEGEGCALLEGKPKGRFVNISSVTQQAGSRLYAHNILKRGGQLLLKTSFLLPGYQDPENS